MSITGPAVQGFAVHNREKHVILPDLSLNKSFFSVISLAKCFHPRMLVFFRFLGRLQTKIPTVFSLPAISPLFLEFSPCVSMLLWCLTVRTHQNLTAHTKISTNIPPCDIHSDQQTNYQHRLYSRTI